MKLHTTFLLICCTVLLNAQTVADFEEYNIPAESFLNGSDHSGGFTSGDVFLPNLYDDEFMAWSGWAISNMTDVTTPGFNNQYSAIAGGGVDGSENYAVTFDGYGNNNIILEGDAAGQPVPGMFVTNSTYAYLSMRDGDAFSKKFGGITGNDPDWFLLTIKAYFNGNLTADSVNFYLADYRFSNNNQDYIVDEWTWVDLTSLGAADSLWVNLSSTDVGQFGMNTPAFFCVDNITFAEPSNTTSVNAPDLFEIYPNPTADYIQISHSENEIMDCSVFDASGRLILQKQLDAFGGQLDLHFLPKGNYIINVRGRQVHSSKVLVKQ